MRGRHVGFHTENPRNPARQRPDTTRIRVKGVPLSADDGQIRSVQAQDTCDKPLQVLSVVVALDGLYKHCIFLF
jgi:hypothetical protein